VLLQGLTTQQLRKFIWMMRSLAKGFDRMLADEHCANKIASRGGIAELIPASVYRRMRESERGEK
jgi:hypothetical protein